MSNLSDVFKYISHFRHAGHQVGRKVGDMLEVLTYAAIVRDHALFSRLHIEPKLFGFCDAGHKVEFTLLSDALYVGEIPERRKGGQIVDPKSVIGFIECKRVGVEQTVNLKFKKQFKVHRNKFYKVPFNESFNINFQSKPAGNNHFYTVTFINNNIIRITKKEDEAFLFEEPVSGGSRIIFTLSEDNRSDVLGNTESLRDKPYTLKNCRILDIDSIESGYVVALLNDCLAGPQTPEKAKQSSFVALDVRKLRFDSFDKRPNETEMISVLVVTEFTHWEKKSRNMITSCLDKVLEIPDALIVEAFIRFENIFGSDFYSYITKDNFEFDEAARKIAVDFVDEHDGKIFIDLDDGRFKRLILNQNNQLSFQA